MIIAELEGSRLAGSTKDLFDGWERLLINRLIRSNNDLEARLSKLEQKGSKMVDFANVPIRGLWLRKKGKDEVEILIETRNGWNLVGTEYYPAEIEVSHIWELGALRNAPPDTLTKK